MTSLTKIMTTYLYFKMKVVIFADISKVATIFIKRILKDSKSVKRIWNCVSKCYLYLYFLIWQNLLISGEKMLMSEKLNVWITWFKYFLDLLKVRYNCTKFHRCRIFLTDFREWEATPYLWAVLERPILNRVKDTLMQI